MGVMEEIKNDAIVKELWSLHSELIREKERLIKELETTGNMKLHYKIDGVDTAISRIERRISEKEKKIMKNTYDIIVDSTGEIYRVKRDNVYTRTWCCRLTKEQEERAIKEIKRVLCE